MPEYSKAGGCHRFVAGAGFKPETPIEKILGLIETIDQVLIMTVNPGAYGSSFIPEALEKVNQLREKYPDIDIEVDGGMEPRTIKSAAGAGANLFVSGSFILKAEEPENAVKALKKEVGFDEEREEDNGS